MTKPLKTLTFEEIDAADDQSPVVVPVPEWGGSVNVYPLTSEQLDEMDAWWNDNPSGAGFRVKLLTLALRDFTPAQVMKLADKRGSAVKRLTEAAADLCAVQPWNEKPLEDVSGNSESGPSDESG